MNSTLWFLLGELGFVSIVFILFFAMVRWRKRKRLMTELHALLERVGASEPGRQEGLQERLNKSVGLDANEAEILSVEIIQSERKLFKLFAEILFGGEIRKVRTFDTAVYQVLDHYWELLAIDTSPENTAATQNQGLEQALTKDSAMESDDASVDSKVFTVESEVSKFSDKTEIDLDVTMPAAEENDPSEGVEISEAADDSSEPNWDDAFAEASQEDETTDSIEEILASATSDNSVTVVSEELKETATETDVSEEVKETATEIETENS